MAAKLTFEAKMQGMEQVLDLLKRAEERMNDFGRVGSYSIEGVDRRLKEFEQSLEMIGKSQSGLGGVFTKFDQMNRQSSEFLGKSYRGIIDAMKQEVKTFEQEADKVMNKVKETESALETFKSRRNAMSEQDFQQGVARHQTEINTLRGQQASIMSEKTQLQRQVMMAQPVNEGLHNVASRFGLGQYATVGGAAGLLAAAAAGVPLAMRTAGDLGVQFGYTRDMDSFIAQARLRRGAASEAMAGDPTTFMLQSGALGNPEEKVMQSLSMRAKVAGSTMMDNALVRAGVIGLAGAGGFLLGGPAGALLAGGTAYGMIGSPLAAGNRTGAQIEAEERAKIRGRLSEMYGNIFKPGAAMLERESSELTGYQRMYGIDGAHNLSMQFAANGVSADRANPFLQMMLAQGLRPTNYGFGDQASAIRMMNRASMDPLVQQQIIRQAAISGGTISGNTMSVMGLSNMAGLNAAGDIAGRGMLNNYVAGMMSDYGAGQTMSMVGAPIAAQIAGNAPGFNKVEGVQQGIMNFQAQENLINGGSSALDMMIISKFRQLGVTNPVAISMFMKMGLRNKNTYEAIAKYVGGGMTAAKVAAVLSETAGSYKNMFEAVLGRDEMKRFNDATGGDAITLLTTGRRAFNNTQAGAEGFIGGLEKSFTTAEGDGTKVNVGAQSFGDLKDKAIAERDTQTDAALREILAGTGQKVTDALTEAIIAGFIKTGEEVRAAGQKLMEQRESNGAAPSGGTKAPFNGTKQQRSRGQEG